MQVRILWSLFLSMFYFFTSIALFLQSINMVEGHLENLLVEYYTESQKPLKVMHERTLAEAVRYYVEKNHDEAFRDVIQ